MIGGLAIRPDADQVLVLDDPALVTEGEPLGMGRLFQVGTPYARDRRAARRRSTGQPALDPSHTADTHAQTSPSPVTPAQRVRRRPGGEPR